LPQDGTSRPSGGSAPRETYPAKQKIERDAGVLSIRRPAPGASFVRLAWVADPIATSRLRRLAQAGNEGMAEDRDARWWWWFRRRFPAKYLSVSLGRRRDIGRPGR